MDGVHETILIFTSNISRHILQLALDDRQILTALLRWDPSVSNRLIRALQSVDSPWKRQSLEEEYFLLLRDLEAGIRQAPIIWAEVARINIRLESLSARLLQVARGSHTLMGHLSNENASEASIFHSAQHVMITGGNFTIHSQDARNTIATASSPSPSQTAHELSTTPSDGENLFCPLRRVFARIEHVIMRIIHEVGRAVRRGYCT
ncbi:hypothetical protein CPC08DRAFT_439018 [Agrocybe pediades]|nr:hypothetical protein CPC08DRAFT_439018 [Agrocybe pediades]